MQRHVILTLGRSGSNTLTDMLNQSPQVLNYGEVLGDWTQIRRLQRRTGLFRRSDAAYLDWILYARHFAFFANAARSLGRWRSGDTGAIKRLRDIRTIGIKEFSLNLRRAGLGDYIANHPDLKVVGLVRENVVDRLVSNLRMSRNGVLYVREGDGADVRAAAGRALRVEPAEMLRHLVVIEEENADLRAMLDRVPEGARLVIRYEDLFRDEASRDAVLRAAFEFLGVTPVATRVRMRKIIQRPVRDLIENFDECLEATKGTRFEAMLRAAAEPAA